MNKEQAIQDVAMIARNGIDRVIELERDKASLRAENAELRGALRIAVSAMEEYEEKVDFEWGEFRNIAEIERDGDLPMCLTVARAALAKHN